ncbi:hypothetical protein GJ744_004911 [Endocarpon pusillum]|uniref:Serine protease n=1 Tax=Endocarpon pusillum TaxID=364733 RepID=A0A8H7E944_9EURO|nr:hypothetical protein GJ744_004911 [Endocarpon pusillum]
MMSSATLTSAPVPTAVGKQSVTAKKPNLGPILPLPRHVKAAVWNLNSTEFTEIEAPENTESLFSGTAGESVIGEDSRKKVNKKDFMPGGKYRSIVKLFLRFAGQDKNAPWAMGTGWLINNDTIVTAGHCSYDHSHNLGRLTHVKAYIGYYGKASINDSKNYAVQFRTGKRVAIPEGWLAGEDNEPRDVSFIQVDRPYTGIKPIKYQPTPLTGNKVILGVVGYPGDLMNPKSKEKGAFMYEMYDATTFDISKTKNKMLQYKVDTYGGNSGSPVIRQPDMASVGVHVLGGNPNSASVISGPYGNPFDAFVTALKRKPKEAGEEGVATIDGKEASWLSWETVPMNETSSGGEGDQPNETATGSPDQVPGNPEPPIPAKQPDPENRLEEGFFDFLKKALKVPGPFGMLASMGMSAVGTVLKKKKEAAFDEAYSFEGVAERALLGEAALTAVVQLGTSKCKDLGIFQRMQPTVLKLRPVCRRAGPTIMPFVIEPAWRMTTKRVTLPTKQTGEGAIEPAHIPTSDDTNTLVFGPRLDANAEAFVRILTKNLTMEDAEAFTGTESTIGEVVGKALRITGPLLGSVAESGLSRLVGDEIATEADIDANPEADLNNPESSEYTYDAMSQRALAGEAALEALLHTPEETLQQEAWWDAVKNVVIKWGPKVLGSGVPVLSGAMAIAAAATNYATAMKNAKKREMEAEAGQDQLDAGENGETGEGDVNGVDPAESAEEEFLATLENGV